MNSISMNTSSHALVVTNGEEKKTIISGKGSVTMGGITYELKESRLTMTSKSAESLKEVGAFFSYTNVKYKFGNEEGDLKSSDMSERIRSNSGVCKKIYREISDKWKYDPSQSKQSVLEKLKGSKAKENKLELGNYKTMGDIYKNHHDALDFFTTQYDKEKNDDYRRIVKGIKELSSRLVEIKEMKEIKK